VHVTKAAGQQGALPLGRIVERLFRRRSDLFVSLRDERGVRGLALRMAGYVVLFGGLYGVVLGIYAGGWQTLYNAVKLPWVLLATLALSAASLYVLNAIAGARMSVAQTVAIALTGLLATVMLLVSLLPVVTFLMFSGSNYSVTVLTNVVAFAICGWYGARFATEAMRAMHDDDTTRRRCVAVMRAWLWLYGLVGLQMAWLLRPYFRQTEVFIRPLGEGGNVFEALVRLVLRVVVGGP
jgi:hypothetical protein